MRTGRTGLISGDVEEARSGCAPYMMTLYRTEHCYRISWVMAFCEGRFV